MGQESPDDVWDFFDALLAQSGNNTATKEERMQSGIDIHYAIIHSRAEK
jgi:hypothetical protein